MYMVSLNQAAGIAREEMTSLDGITAELLNFIQLKSQRLYMHSLQVANYSVSIAAKLMLPKSEIEQIKYAALLHDVGLLVVSNTLLVKIPYLNRSEMAVQASCSGRRQYVGKHPLLPGHRALHPLPS